MDQAACCVLPKDRAKQRRARVVEAARDLFIANGFHATAVAQIAKLSGIAIGQLYRDFAAKEEIVAEIVLGDCTAFMAREELARAIRIADRDAVWLWLRRFIEPDEDAAADALFADIVAESARNPRIAEIVARTRDDVRRCMLDALALLAPGDRVANRRAVLADLIVTQSLGLMQHRLMDPALDCARLVDAIMATVSGEIDRLHVLAAES